MSTVNHDYDEVLRRVLRAAADSVEPSADGLERIRARLSGPQLWSMASAAAWYSDVATRFMAWAVPFLQVSLTAFWSAVDRFRPMAGTSSARAAGDLAGCGHWPRWARRSSWSPPAHSRS